MADNAIFATPVRGSFRDPSGTVFKNGEELYRQVNVCYADESIISSSPVSLRS